MNRRLAVPWGACTCDAFGHKTQETRGPRLGGGPSREEYGSITIATANLPLSTLPSPNNEDEEVFHDYHRKRGYGAALYDSMVKTKSE